MKELINILILCIKHLNSVELLFTIIIGIVIAILFWVLCSYYSLLWNKNFKQTIKHHVICAFAAFLTFLFVLSFSSMKNLKEVATAFVNSWSAEILTNHIWSSNTYNIAYDSVKSTGYEDFKNVPLPDNTNSFIPVNDNRSKFLCASIYTNEACKNFNDLHPFLSKVIWTKPELPQEIIKNDMLEYFKTNKLYPPARAIHLASDQINQNLIRQTPRIVKISRFLISILFVIVQLIPLSIIGYSAYKDLKSKT